MYRYTPMYGMHLLSNYVDMTGVNFEKIVTVSEASNNIVFVLGTSTVYTWPSKIIINIILYFIQIGLTKKFERSRICTGFSIHVFFFLSVLKLVGSPIDTLYTLTHCL